MMSYDIVSGQCTQPCAKFHAVIKAMAVNKATVPKSANACPLVTAIIGLDDATKNPVYLAISHQEDF